MFQTDIASFAAAPPSPMVFSLCEAAENPKLKAFHALWEMRRGARSMPERSEISPRDMKDYLSDVHLYELIEGGRDFRIRLVGTGFSRAAGYDATGEILSRVAYAPVRDRMMSCARQVAETSGPIYAYAEHGARAHLHNFRVEAMMVPLATAGALSHVLGHVLLTPRIAA